MDANINAEQTLVDLTRRYIEFFNDPYGTAEQLKQFISPEIAWEEKPNRFAPTGRTNDYTHMLTNFEIGQQYINPQTYKIDNIVVQGEKVAIQLSWTGTVVQTIGPFPIGAKLTAQVASFLQFKDGKLISQVDYPCYPPFEEPAANEEA